MKRVILCMLLCLVLLCCGLSAALAEQTLTSVTGLYTCSIPDEYLILDAETIDTLVANLSVNGFTDKYGVDEKSAEEYIALLSQLDTTSSDYVFSTDFSCNLNVQVIASERTAESLVSDKDIIDEKLTAQYTAYGVSAEDCLPQEILTDDNSGISWYRFHVALLGADIWQYITCDTNGMLYTFTFENFAEEDISAVIASVAFTQN